MDARWATMVVVSLSLAASTAMARIGETPAECTRRYGAPVGVDATTGAMEFRRGSFAIVVGFSAGQADSITFWKLARAGTGGPQWMSVREIHALLRANACGEEWQPGFPPGGPAAYSEGNGVDPWYTNGAIGLAAFYHYSVGRQHLSIRTLDHLRRQQAAQWVAIQNTARRRAVDPEAAASARPVGF